MPCYHPLQAYTLAKRSANGKSQITFKNTDAGIMSPISLPCGQCIGCRLDRSLDWAVRISLEASLYDLNCFITLTFDAAHLPADGSLDVKHWQDFMKRLKSHVRRTKGKAAAKRIRFFHCGEYGDKLGRPHYHACLLDFDFDDKWHFYTNDRGDRIYRSSTLEALWPFGHSEIGEVNFDSAAYVARYCTKKVTGDAAADHYARVDADTGEIYQLKPEYTTMSRKPGIGAPWLKRNPGDVYSYDYVVLRSGAKVQPPRFFDKTFEVLDPDRFAQIHKARLHKRHKADLDPVQQLERTYERRIVREAVQLATVDKQLKRKLESECP